LISINAKLSSQVDNNGSRSVTRLRWDKADIVSYYEATNVLSSNIDIDSDYDKILIRC